MKRCDPKVTFHVVLDAVSVARLMDLASDCRCDPTIVLASLVHDLLEDDARMHADENNFWPEGPVTLQ